MAEIIQQTALITINNTVMPTPSKYNIPMHDIDSSDSSYSESGLYIRNRVRQGVCQLALAWVVKGGDASTILNAIKPDKVQVKYYDPRTGTYSSAEMYVEDRSCNLINYMNGENSNSNLWEISFNLIQY